MQPLASLLVWSGISLLGAAAFGVLALSRGETVNAAWLLTAAVCTYAVGYRFYSKFLADRVFGLDDRRATPAERCNNGRDFVPTNKWVLYGHHFAAIAGAGPLVGPVLAAQFGFLPGTLWLVIGVVLGGAVQDFVILVCSLRRDGKSLGQMAKEEVNPAAGATAMLAVLFIMIILLAVLALIVVNALKASPWGLFTIACTIPIALLMGWWMKSWRPGNVGEASAVGAVLLLGALVGGGWVAGQPHLAPLFTHGATALTWMMMGYGFIASVLPVWMLLCPRDYLSTFLKITTILVLAAAILVILPPLRMPALTPFASLGEAGFVVTPEAIEAVAARMGETTLVARSGGAPSLAVGMAQIFAGATGALGGRTLDALWYHFAIMFEALFILTTIDTGTRVGRFMLQEIVGHVWPRFAETSWYPSVIASSAAVVAGWGYFLYQGVVDPLGGINSLWPLFGISNQLLAAVALCVGTTILIKMGRARFAWVTAAPLAWLVTVTMTAGWQKVFSADPRLGFLAHAASLAGSANPDTARLIFNDRLNTFVALLFMTIVTALIVTSLREWWLVLSHRKTAIVHEAPYVETEYATGD